MSSKAKDEDTNYEDWWDEELGDDSTYLWQQAVEDFFIYHDTKPKDYRFGAKLVKQMIGHVAVRDAKWRKFPLDSFNTGQHEAHNQLYHALRNKFNSMVEKAEKAKADAEAKAKADEKARLPY